MSEKCLGCYYNKHPEKEIGGKIKEYNYWNLKHVDKPVPHQGWLILNTKRHVVGIAGMNKNEAKELAEILFTVPKAIKKIDKAKMVYIVCMTEAVKHLHIHIIPRYENDKIRGGDLFALNGLVKKGKIKPVPAAKCLAIIKKLKKELN